MNCSRIQEILEAEPKFLPVVSKRDFKITTKGSDHYYASLTVVVAQALEKAGLEDNQCSRAIVLAAALRFSSGPLPPIDVTRTSTLAAPKLAPKPKPKPRPRPQEPKTPVVAPVVAAPLPPKPPEPVIVKCAPNPAVPVRPQNAFQAKLDQFVANGEMLKFQCCVAAGQLLAALYQLADQDTQPGHEERKSLITALVDRYEEMSKGYINLSVKQIIRGKLEEEIAKG